MKTMLIRVAFILVGLLALPEAHAVSKDLRLLESAREQYNAGNFAKAVNIYNKIPKGSDYYVDALEEKAQAFGRQGKFAESMSELKSAMAPQFSGLIAPQVFLTAVVTDLKTCNYSGVLETNQKFKKEFSERAQNLTEMVSSENSELLNKIVDRSVTRGLSYESLGPLARKAPRALLKDRIALQNQKRAFELRERIQNLAKLELDQIQATVDKLSVAEVEVQHRISLLASQGGRNKQSNFEKSGEVLTFPDDDEVWLDEIGNFQGQVEKCPKFVRRAGL